MFSQSVIGALMSDSNLITATFGDVYWTKRYSGRIDIEIIFESDDSGCILVLHFI